MKINEYLLQFLSTGNKEAAIPGLGVFYTDLRNTISFREIAPTDRAFIKYVAQKSGVDEIAVSSSIDVWVKSILQDLKTMGRAIIEDIGSFEVTGNKVIFAPETPEIPIVETVYEAEKDLPVEKPTDTFGMEDEEDAYAPALKDDEGEENSFVSKNLWWIILVSVVIMAIIVVFLIPSTRERVMSFIPSGRDGQVKEVVLGLDAEKTVEGEVVTDIPAEAVVDVETKLVAKDERVQEKPEVVTPASPVTKPAAKPATSATKSSTVSTQVTAKCKYNIIAGTYKERPNADKEVQRFRKLGYSNARVVLSDGFYYVSINSFATRDEAVNYRLKLTEKNVQGWIKEL